MEAKKPDLKAGPALRTIAMPADTNASGDIFGGWILAQMDLAGASIAIEYCGKRVATVGIKSMSFYKPVFVGDEVSCYARIKDIGNTSITVHIDTWVQRQRSGEAVRVTEGEFTYVALDKKRQPVSVRKSKKD